MGGSLEHEGSLNMGLIRPVLNDFSAGEISPRLAGRIDLPVFHKGAQEITNFRIRALGGVSKRPGTKYIARTRSDLKARLIPWTIDADTSFLIELTAGKIRFLDVASGAWVSSGGSPIEITTTYTEDVLFEVKYAQTFRECYLVHPGYAPIWFRYASGTPTTAVFEYTTSDQSFAGNLLEWTAPTATPYDILELWEAVARWLMPRKSYPASGTFNAKTLASIVRQDLSLILTFSDASTLTLTRGTTYSHQGSISIDLRPFMGAGNYPGAAAFWGGRLLLGGSLNDPATLWGSKPWDYKNFVLVETLEYSTKEEKPNTRSDHTAASTSGNTTIASIAPAVVAGALVNKYATGQNIPYGAKVLSNTINSAVLDMASIGDGTAGVSFSDWKDANVPEYQDATEETQQIGAANAFRLQLATEEEERIIWIAGARDLFVGTSSSEWAIPGQISAIQAQAIIASRYGSADIQARFLGDSLLYVATSSRHLRQLGAELAPPLTTQAEHILRPGVVQIDYTQAPEVSLYAALADGDLVRCLLEPAISVLGWDRTRVRAGDLIEAVAVVGGSDRDLVYLSVKRTINGAVKRFIELLQDNEDDTTAHQWYLDAALEKTGAAFTVITGLSHFEGQEIQVRYTPAAGGTPLVVLRTVASGQVTIPSATYALAGLPFTAKLKTHRLELSDTEGLAKGVGTVFFRLFRSFGFILKYSDDATKPTMPVAVPASPYTGLQPVTTDIPTLQDAELVIESSDPIPVGIQSIVPEVVVGG